MTSGPWDDYKDVPYTPPSETTGGPWDDYKEDGTIATPEGPSTGEAIYHGATQGASFGFQDEISPWFEKLFGKLGLSEQEYKDLYGNKSHKDLRDEYRKENAAAQEAHPMAYMGGEIAGSLPALIGTGGSSTAGIGARVGLGAAQGGAMAAGASNAELTGENQDIGKFIRDIATGTAIGGAVPLVTTGAGALARKGMEALKKVPGNAALRELGATPEAIEQMGGRAKARELTELLVNPSKGSTRQPVMKLFDSAETIAEKLKTEAPKISQYARTAEGGLEAVKGPQIPTLIEAGELKASEGILKTPLSKVSVGGLLGKFGAPIAGGFAAGGPLGATLGLAGSLLIDAYGDQALARGVPKLIGVLTGKWAQGIQTTLANKGTKAAVLALSLAMSRDPQFAQEVTEQAKTFVPDQSPVQEEVSQEETVSGNFDKTFGGSNGQ